MALDGELETHSVPHLTKSSFSEDGIAITK